MFFWGGWLLCLHPPNPNMEPPKMEISFFFKRGISGVMLVLGGVTVSRCFLVVFFAIKTGWWFQICFIFTPTWGNDPT